MTAVAVTPVDPATNRTMMLISIMLAMVMTVLDQTIANVALPHMPDRCRPRRTRSPGF